LRISYSYISSTFKGEHMNMDCAASQRSPSGWRGG
jgi:hypothetical protein